MRLRKIGYLLSLIGALGLLLPPFAFADGDRESTGVQNTDGDPSPSAGTIRRHSNVDDYTNQDEQININGNQDSIVRVLRVNQKNLLNDYVVGVFPIRNAPPIELRNCFRQITAAEGGRAEVIRDKKRKEFFLWVVAPKFQMPHIEAALQALDVPWLTDDIDGSSQIYYRAKFRAIESVHAMARFAASAGLRGTGADNNVNVDAANDAALFIGEPYRGRRYAEAAAQVDRPIPQLILEAAVYEIEVSRALRLGLDYIGWKNGPGRNLFECIAWGADYEQRARHMTSVYDPFVPARTAVAGTQTIEGDGRGRYCSWNYLVHSAWADFLAGTGRARLVTRGKVLVKNGETGTLSAVDEVLHFLVSTNEHYRQVGEELVPNTPVSGIDPTRPLDNDIRVWDRTLRKNARLEIGFVMTVRPYISQETTELHITLALNNIVGQTPSGTPQVRTHTLTTTVLVADGQEICIAGLRRTEDVKNTAKMPILGSIPVLGYLFGHEATAKRETEMVVVLTPKIRFGSEADLEMASDEDKLVRQQVLRQAKLPLPRTEFGFDQWLLDEER